MRYGDDHSYLVGVVTLDPEEIGTLARELGIKPDLATLARDPGVHERLAEDVETANQRFSRIAQMKRFAILEQT